MAHTTVLLQQTKVKKAVKFIPSFCSPLSPLLPSTPPQIPV